MARDDDDRRRASTPRRARSRKRARADDARDFAALARRDARLGARVEWRVDARGAARATVDFKSWDGTRALTGAILREEYGVEAWTVPRGRLVPTATNRERYLEWLARLRELSAPSDDDATNVRVLDIGTGASAIYALLGAAGRGWRFVGTDVCDEALTSARENVRRNPHLESLIEIRDARGEDGARDRVLRGVVRDGETFTFCMCNPPFFETMDEAGMESEHRVRGHGDGDGVSRRRRGVRQENFRGFVANEGFDSLVHDDVREKEHDDEDALVPSHASRARHPHHGTFARENVEMVHRVVVFKRRREQGASAFARRSRTERRPPRARR